jgi:hypothetical protein
MRSAIRVLMAGVVAAGLLAGALMYLTAPSPPSLPEDLRQALRLLPTDIESLAGTLKPFVFDQSDKKGDWFKKPNAVLTFGAILDLNLSKTNSGESFHAALANIHGREALWAVSAKRNQEVQRERNTSMIVLGMHPYESITIIKFRAALPAKLEQALSWSSSVTTLPNGGRIFRQENSATAAVIPQPDLLILVTMIGSDDAMLKSLIRRIEHPGDGLAFDDAARAWSLTDLDASLWAIRRTKEAKPGRRQDNVGRDWEVFAYDQSAPDRALFRSIKARWPWRGQVGNSRTDHEPVTPERVGWGGGYADTRSECAPGTGLQCFLPSFVIDVLGIMIWV